MNKGRKDVGKRRKKKEKRKREKRRYKPDFIGWNVENFLGTIISDKRMQMLNDGISVARNFFRWPLLTSPFHKLRLRHMALHHTVLHRKKKQYCYYE